MKQSLSPNRFKKLSIFYTFFSVYMILLFSSGFGFQNNNGTLALFILNFIPILYVFLINKRLTFNFYTFVIFSFLLTNILITSFINNDSIKDLFITILFYCSSFLISISLTKNELVKVFKNLIILISIFSIITFVLTILFPDIVFYFPRIISKYDGKTVYFLFLSFIKYSPNGIQFGNQGLFWEPGAFVSYLGLIFIFEMSSKKPKILNLFLIFFTLLSTFSSVGYFIAMIVLFILFITILKSFKSLISFIFFPFLIGFTFIIIYNFVPNYILRSIYVKIVDFINGNNTNGSVSARLDSFIYPFQIFISNLFLGGGKNSFYEITNIVGHQNFVFTPINWFAKYGISFGFFVLFLYLYFFFSLWKSKKVFLFVALILPISILIISTQEFSENPSFLVFLFYSINEIFYRFDFNPRRIPYAI